MIRALPLALLGLASTASAALPDLASGEMPQPADYRSWESDQATRFFIGWHPDDSPSPRIVNGDEAISGQFPEVVSLASRVGGGLDSFCTGSVIDARHVLTAAHCLEDVADRFENGGTGVIVWGQAMNDYDYVVEWESYEWNAAYDPEAIKLTSDVGIVTLSEDAPVPFYMSLNEDAMSEDWIGSPMTFAGFGITQWQGSGGGVKRYAQELVHDYDTTTLYSFDGLHSTCQGDSGGPGMVHVVPSDITSPYSQVSVTSYGPECGKGPSGSMRVDVYAPWIRERVPDIRTKPAAPPSFTCSRLVNPESDQAYAFGAVPFEVLCTASYFDPTLIQEVTWTWGDGGEDSGFDVSHTYTEEGSYNVSACFKFEGQAEDDPGLCLRRGGYVRACDVPRAEFSYEQIRGLTYQFINNSDLGTYGCISDVQWDIFEGTDTSGTPVDSLNAWQPEYTFPSRGDYTVVLNVGGAAGTGAAALEMTARNVGRRDPVCSSAGGATGWAGLSLAFGLIGLGRRRRA